MKKTFNDLYQEALEALKENDDLFVRSLEELDNWNGYADGFRAYPMDELDDLFCDCKVSEFLTKITPSFDLRDEYMIDTIYGLDSTDDVVDHYRSQVCDDELLDNLIARYDDLDLEYIDPDFNNLIQRIIDAKEEVA